MHVIGDAILIANRHLGRAGIGRWRWMPKPAEILDLYREVAAPPTNGHPHGAALGCEACDGTGWVPVPGGRAVTPCQCPKGRSRKRAARD